MSEYRRGIDVIETIGMDLGVPIRARRSAICGSGIRIRNRLRTWEPELFIRIGQEKVWEGGTVCRKVRDVAAVGFHDRVVEGRTR
jgi:hypothetical protein